MTSADGEGTLVTTPRRDPATFERLIRNRSARDGRRDQPVDMLAGLRRDPITGSRP